MPLFELTSDSFRQIDPVSFADMKVRERKDIQRLLRTQIDLLGDDLFVLDEEFSEWEDSRRRIDLLAIDSDAKLVVIELKVTADGGHMELQALRYASMVSAMTFARAERIHQDFLVRIGKPGEDARTRMLEFLKWDEPDEEIFANDVRIVLVSEDFGKELTTNVLWLRERDIDIRCIRMLPHLDGEKRLVYIQQIIPLPEANDYQVHLREKEQVVRKLRTEHSDVKHDFWVGLLALARARKTRHADITPGSRQWLSASSGVRGLDFNYVIWKDNSGVELYFFRDTAAANKALFDRIHDNRKAIETTFGAALGWERLDGKKACRIKHLTGSGGYQSPESQWAGIHENMVDAMIRFEKALLPIITSPELKP